MKKILATAFAAGLILASCAKQESVSESNTMLAEPDAPVVTAAPKADSTAVVAPKAADSTVKK